MAVEDIPPLYPNIKVMIFWGLIRNHNIQRYLISIPFGCLNLAQWLFMILCWDDATLDMIYCFYFTVLFSTALLRTLHSILQSKKFLKLLAYVESEYNLIIVSKFC